MISNLPSILSRHHIVAYLLPAAVLLFCVDVVLSVMHAPLLVPDLRMDSLPKASMFLAAAFALSFVLMTSNTFIIMTCEGYHWLPSRQKRKEKMLAAYDKIQSEITALQEKVEATEQENEKLIELEQAFADYFPRERESVLATRLGNAIRAFESYPDRVYGLESIAVWPRLYLLLDVDEREVVAESKSIFDFWLNLSLVGGTLVGICALAFLYDAAMVVTGGKIQFSLANAHALVAPGLKYLALAVAFGIVACVAWRLAISSAVSWGVIVKSCFDLFRGKLVEQVLNNNAAGAFDRQLWEDVGQSFLYRRKFPYENWQHLSPTKEKKLGDLPS